MAYRSHGCACLLLGAAAIAPSQAQNVDEANQQKIPAADENPDPASPAPPPEGEVIIVTGTRIVTPNRQSASPVETVRAQDFTLTGVSNVEQTLNLLPQLVPSFTNTSNNPGTGAATLDLRGLGSVRTLILVNGRRWIANDAGEIPEIDVNTIPASLIDRVDIVTGGASAVYGSDAVTGVINFILKDKLRGLHLDGRQNLTERGDASVSSADLSFGTGGLGGRANLIASVGWLKQEPVVQGARGFSAFAGVDGCVVAGSQDEYGIGQPTNNLACDGPNEERGMVRGGSGIIPQSRVSGAVFLPSGVGGGLTRIAANRFATGGEIVPYLGGTDAYNFAPVNYLQVPLERISANLLGSVEISTAFEPFVELSYIRTRSPQQLAPVPAVIGSGADSVFPALINLDNPFLSAAARQALDISFGRDSANQRGFLGSAATGFLLNPAYTGDADGLVSPGRISSRLSGLGPRGVANNRDAYRGLIGLRGKIAKSWSYEAFYSRSYVAHDALFSNSASAKRLQQALLAQQSPSGQIVCIDQSNGCAPINIFGEQDISPQAADFLRINPVETTRVKEQIAELSLKGDVVQLPAGPLKTALGAGWRRTSYVFMPDNSFEDGDSLGFFKSSGAAGSTAVFELFGEALVPILADKSFAHDLSAELGLRYSDYDSVGGVWTWKALMNWAPLRQIRFRAGLQQAIRAPNVRELYEESVTNFGGPFDPCAPVWGVALDATGAAACARDGAANLPLENYDTLVTTGGSTDLKAETARTLTIGAVVQPIAGLTATVDYFDIDIRDAIDVFGGGAQFVVAGCIAGGGDPADPLCQAYERDEDGFVSTLRIPNANLARLRTTGIDWQLSYGFPLLSGRLQLNLSGTRLLRSETRVNPNLDALRCAGFHGYPCGNTIVGTATPKWKLFNRASWAIGPATVSLRHRYFSATKAALFAMHEAIGLEPPTIVPVNAIYMQSRHYFDSGVTFDIARRFQLTVGVNNLFDTQPSLVGGGQVQANTDPSLYDVLGRRFFVAINAKLF